MFPAHYPDSCPPADAVNPDGESVFYRVVTTPTTVDDVKSPYELSLPHAVTCDDRALSLFRGYKGAQRIIRSYSWAAGKAIARMCPKPEWGLQLTGKQRGSSTHTNLWLYHEVNRADVLAAIAPCEEEAQA